MSRKRRTALIVILPICVRPLPASLKEGSGFPLMRSATAARTSWPVPAALWRAAPRRRGPGSLPCSCRPPRGAPPRRPPALPGVCAQPAHEAHRKSGGSNPASARRCRSCSAPGQLQDSRRTLKGTARRLPVTGQRHKLAPNSGRSRRGLNPPPMATKCGQAR